MSMPGASPTIPAVQKTGRAILVADDEDALRTMLCEYLEERGHEVLEAANGVEAIRLIEQGRCAAVVLDLVMPRLGGLDAIPQILKLEPSIPIIVVTGHASQRALGELKHWSVPVLSKPINLTDLEALIAKGLGPHVNGSTR
jgi:CheY-like chemotaxis protein